MKRIKSIYVIIMIIMLLAIAGLIYYNYNYKLTSFEIINFNQNFNQIQKLNTLEFEENKNANEYIINIYNDDKLIRKIETKENVIKLNDMNIPYDSKVVFSVYAKNKLYKIKSNKDLEIKWNLPSIDLKKETVVNNENLEISVPFDTKIDKNHYFLNIDKKFNKLSGIEIKDNKVILSKDILKNILGEVTLQLIVKKNEHDYVFAQKKIKIVLPEINDIEFITPAKEGEVKWDDFDLVFNGGENATHYDVSILEESVPIIEQRIKERKLKIDISRLKENTEYSLIIIASNEKDAKLTKRFETKFKTKGKEKASNVSANINSQTVYIGTQLVLSSSTNNSSIYYTTDGTIPTVNSTKYNSSITINWDTTIKAIAISKNYFDSDIVTFAYKAIPKPIVIYLSPSNQTWNKGVQSIGYTNESLIMNRLADVVESILKQRGFVVYRNKSSMTLDQIVNQSKSLNVNLHLALHSNASANAGSMTGIETYVYSKSSLIAPLARNIQSSLESIYYKSNPRRLIYGLEENYILREINPKRVDNGILIEVAYHDNETDATWILTDINQIGNTIANTVASYFGK